MAAKKRFSVYITESQPDLSGQVSLHWVMCPAVILKSKLRIRSHCQRSQKTPRCASQSALPDCACSCPGRGREVTVGHSVGPRGLFSSHVQGTVSTQSQADVTEHCQLSDSSYGSLRLPGTFSDVFKMSFAVRKWPKPCATSTSLSLWSWMLLLGKHPVPSCGYLSLTCPRVGLEQGLQIGGLSPIHKPALGSILPLN